LLVLKHQGVHNFSLTILIASFVYFLTAGNAEMVEHTVKLSMILVASNLLHIFVVLPPLLILCSTTLRLVCSALTDSCREALRCEPDEDANSIYYLPTKQALDVPQAMVDRRRHLESNNMEQLPPPPASRRMIMAPEHLAPGILYLIQVFGRLNSYII